MTNCKLKTGTETRYVHVPQSEIYEARNFLIDKGFEKPERHVGCDGDTYLKFGSKRKAKQGETLLKNEGII